MKPKVRWRIEKRKRRIEKRLSDARERCDSGRPVLTRNKPSLEVAERVRAMPYGGIVVAHHLAVQSGLVDAIDSSLELLKVHRPYHESDHVLNIAYNALCGGQCLDDIEHRRNDEAFLDALGTMAIPDPTTAGDFCRRFDEKDVVKLMEVINKIRSKVWASQPSSFLRQTALIDVDGTLVTTTGECKGGMGLSYKGTWGYHPLLVSLANTAEPLFIVNRPGNQPSQDGAVDYMDKAVALCRRAGFTDILLRGDSAFSLTRQFDRWHTEGVRFVFSYKVDARMKARADSVAEEEYQELIRRAEQSFDRKQRAKQPRHKEAFVRLKGYKNIRLRSEDVAEFEYKPRRAKRSYRIVVLRKNLTIEQGAQALIDDIRYFLYVTNDPDMKAVDVVRHSNDRCNQENLIEQLKNGVHALHAPVNTLVANWAYMVMTSLAWTLKAWMALKLPICPRWRKKHVRERLAWLRMGFRTFVNSVIQMPAQVLETGRKRVVRLLAWKPHQPIIFRLLKAL